MDSLIQSELNDYFENPPMNISDCVFLLNRYKIRYGPLLGKIGREMVRLTVKCLNNNRVIITITFDCKLNFIKNIKTIIEHLNMLPESLEIDQSRQFKNVLEQRLDVKYHNNRYLYANGLVVNNKINSRFLIDFFFRYCDAYHSPNLGGYKYSTMMADFDRLMSLRDGLIDAIEEVKRSPALILYIKNPSAELIDIAVKAKPALFRFFVN